MTRMQIGVVAIAWVLVQAFIVAEVLYRVSRTAS